MRNASPHTHVQSTARAWKSSRGPQSAPGPRGQGVVSWQTWWGHRPRGKAKNESSTQTNNTINWWRMMNHIPESISTISIFKPYNKLVFNKTFFVYIICILCICKYTCFLHIHTHIYIYTVYISHIYTYDTCIPTHTYIHTQSIYVHAHWRILNAAFRRCINHEELDEGHFSHQPACLKRQFNIYDHLYSVT